MQPQDDALLIRARMAPGTRFHVTLRDFTPDNVDTTGAFVVEHQTERGLMCRAEGDPIKRLFVPVGCVVGPTDSVMDQDNEGFTVSMRGMAGTTIRYRLLPTVYWSLIEKPGGRWLALEEGEDFTGMLRRLFDVLSETLARSTLTLPRVLIVGKEAVQAHPDLYPLQEPVEPKRFPAPGTVAGTRPPEPPAD